MKKITLYLTLLTFFALAISCESDDKVVEGVLAGNTSGAILRTLDSDGSFDMFRIENTFMVTLEEQDEDQGELIDRVLVTIDFVDNNDDMATGDDGVEGVEFATIPASAFSIGERGLPTTDFSFTMEEALTAMGIPLTEVLPGDRITINLELFFTDGRSFNAGDAATTVTGGSFFSSPFMYSLLVDDGVVFERKGVNANDLNLVPGEVNGDYSVTISIDDEEEGALLETLNIYRTFRDLTIDETGTDLSETEALFATFPVSSLMLDDEARTLSYVIPLNDLLGSVMLTDLGLGDDFQLRYELVAADGRIITTDEPGTEYFDVVPTTRCIQLNRDMPVAGEYVIEFIDSFGDGWDGASITVDIDGSATDYTLENGSEGEQAFTVPEGAMSLILTYNSGSFESEHSYVIVDPFGSDAASDGPGPNVGVIDLRVCQPEE